MGHRELKSGDRVKVTGPSFSGRAGERHIGEYARVVLVDKSDTKLPLLLQIDRIDYLLWWSRENVRALPRKK